MGKVTLLVIGLFMAGALAAPAMAVSYQNGWSYTASPYGTYYSGSPYSSYYGSPYGMGGLGGTTDLGSIYGPFGPFGMGSSLGGPGYSYGYPGSYSPYGYSTGYSPAGTDLGQISTPSSSGSPFSNFGNLLGGSLFKQKTYGPPPTDTITKTLVGQKLTYNSGYMGIPLQYQVEKSDIGDIAGTQYKGKDAWKVRVGQQGMFWDVILDSTGTSILSETQVQ